MKIPLTVIIPCKNERIHIADAIASVQDLADEIIIADNGSTDGTLEIVREIGGCKIIEREFIGYANFKNWAIPQAKNEWVLVLDADERMTPKLAEEIRTLLTGKPEFDAYRMQREVFFLGHRIYYSGWNTSYITRLLKRDKCRYKFTRAHEEIETKGITVGHLQGVLLHYTAQDLMAFMSKQLRYARLGGEDLAEAGQKPNYLYMFCLLPVKFFYYYILRGGILDGYAGLVLSVIMSSYTFLKSARLWELTDETCLADARETERRQKASIREMAAVAKPKPDDPARRAA